MSDSLTAQFVIAARVALMLIASRWTATRRYAAVMIIAEAVRRALLRIPSGDRPSARDSILLTIDAILFVAPTGLLAVVLGTPELLLVLVLGITIMTIFYVVGDTREFVLVGMVMLTQSFAAARMFVLPRHECVHVHRSRWACTALALVSVSGAAFAAHGWCYVTLGNAVAYTALCCVYLYTQRSDKTSEQQSILVP